MSRIMYFRPWIQPSIVPPVHVSFEISPELAQGCLLTSLVMNTQIGCEMPSVRTGYLNYLNALFHIYSFALRKPEKKYNEICNFAIVHSVCTCPSHKTHFSWQQFSPALPPWRPWFDAVNFYFNLHASAKYVVVFFREIKNQRFSPRRSFKKSVFRRF